MKTTTWTPQSNRDREINGITFDHQGNKAINAKKKAQYLRLFEDMINSSVNDLFTNSFYRHKFSIVYGSDSCVQNILATLN